MGADIDSRATEVAAEIEKLKQPVQPVILRVWAMRKGWTFADLDTAIARAVELGKLSAADKGLSKAATPAPAPKAETQPAPPVEAKAARPSSPPAPALDGCLCARTWPKKNFGCPEHGGARINAKQENINMAKQWITSAEAAELLECVPRNVNILAAKGKLESRRTTESPTSPLELNRASVIAHRDAKRKAKADRDLLPATPTKRKAAPPKSKALAKASASGGAPVALQTKPIEGELVGPAIDMTEVRALVRIVGRAGIDKTMAWDWLVKLVA